MSLFEVSSDNFKLKARLAFLFDCFEGELGMKRSSTMDFSINLLLKMNDFLERQHNLSDSYYNLPENTNI